MRLTRAGVASASSACCSARCSSSRSSAMALYLAELRMQREELFRHLVLRRKINQRRGAVVGFTHDHAAGYMVGENRQTLAFQFLDQLARRSEEHTSELQSRENLVCRLLLEKKKQK